MKLFFSIAKIQIKASNKRRSIRLAVSAYLLFRTACTRVEYKCRADPETDGPTRVFIVGRS